MGERGQRRPLTKTINDKSLARGCRRDNGIARATEPVLRHFRKMFRGGVGEGFSGRTGVIVGMAMLLFAVQVTFIPSRSRRSQKSTPSAPTAREVAEVCACAAQIARRKVADSGWPRFGRPMGYYFRSRTIRLRGSSAMTRRLSTHWLPVLLRRQPHPDKRGSVGTGRRVKHVLWVDDRTSNNTHERRVRGLRSRTKRK